MRTYVRRMYAELHAHTAFSYLDGASLPDELATAAAQFGYEALAVTDHNSVSGSMEFAQAAAPLGLRAIHGAEVDLAGGRHLTLLVEDEQGWRNLCHILTRAHAHTRGAVDEAVETGAGDLPARWVIHAATMGLDGRTSADIIRRATAATLWKAEELNARSLALVAFGTGVGGFPLEEAARLMVGAAREHGGRLERIVFAVRGDEARAAFQRALEA